MYTANPLMKCIVGGFNPSSADGVETVLKSGRAGDLIMSQQFGNYSERNSRGLVGFASVAAVTLPVIAASLVSVFTLYNPVNSGIYMELIEADFSSVLATTVVDTVGLYSSTAAATALGTFTTKGNPRSGILQNGFIGAGQFYSAYTHSGTPTLEAIIGGWAAVTDSALNTVHKDFKGAVLIPPGIAASFAMTTAASTASGITGSCSWVERPV